MAATLYAVPASHPCACVERALQLKAIEYRRVDLPPVAHKAIQKALFGGSTVPGLVLDGEKILGSLPHHPRARASRRPSRRCCPSDAKERKSVELAEGWGDEVLQPLVRRVLWAALARAPARDALLQRGLEARDPGARSRGSSAPLIARAEQRINDASDLNVRADLAHLDSHLARVDRWIEHDVIGGEQPNAADLQIGAGLALLLTIEDVASRCGDAAGDGAGATVVPGVSGARAGGGAAGRSGCGSGERQRRLGRRWVRTVSAVRDGVSILRHDPTTRVELHNRSSPPASNPLLPSRRCRSQAATRSGGPERRTAWPGPSARSASATSEPSGSVTSGDTSSSGTSTNRRDVTSACGSRSRSDANDTSPSNSTSTSIGRGPCRTPPASPAQLALDRLARVEQRLRARARSRPHDRVEELRLVEHLADRLGVVDRRRRQHLHADARQRVDRGLQMRPAVADVRAEPEVAGARHRGRRTIASWRECTSRTPSSLHSSPSSSHVPPAPRRVLNTPEHPRVLARAGRRAPRASGS